MGCQRGRDSSGSGARPMGRQGSGRSGDCWGCETPMRTPTLTRQTQRLNVNIWTSLQSCCASDPLEHLKENLFPACLSDTGRAEETDPEMYCTNMHVTINPMLTFVTFDFSYDVNSARIIPPPHELTIIFWTATGDKLCWALWVKSFIVVIFIVVSKTQDTSEIWGPVSFSPQVLWVYIYMETCSVSVSKYQDMLFTNGQHKWVRKKKKVFFLHQTVQLSAPSSSSDVPRQIKLCHRQEQRSVSMSGPPQGDSSHPPPSCCHNVA